MIVKVKIVETLERVVEVEADSFDEAQGIVESKYCNCEIVLDSDDYTGVEYFPA